MPSSFSDEEMYGMIWWLAAQLADGSLSERARTQTLVERARQNYREGIEIARRANDG